MLDFLVNVLEEKDLTQASNLFNINDAELEPNISQMLDGIRLLATQSDYNIDSNAQSIVELCLSRVLSAIRSNNWIEENIAALIAILDICLGFALVINRPRSGHLTESSPKFHIGREVLVDSPHAKIACDLICCIFQFYEKQWVMKLSLPVATRFLLKDNPGISRSLTSFLRLAAQHHPALLSQEIPILVQSIVISHNFELLETLIDLFPHNPTIFVHEASFLLSLLSVTMPCSEQRILCLRLISMIGQYKLQSLESGVDQIMAATDCSTSYIVMPLIQRLSQIKLTLFQGHITWIRDHLDPSWPLCLITVLQLLNDLARSRPSLLNDSVETILYFLARMSKIEHIVSTLVALQDIALFAGRWLQPYLSRIEPYCYQLGAKGDTLLGNLRTNVTRNPDPFYSSTSTLYSTNGQQEVNDTQSVPVHYPQSVPYTPESYENALISPQVNQKLSVSKTSLSLISTRTISSDKVYNQRHYRLAQLPVSPNTLDGPESKEQSMCRLYEKRDQTEGVTSNYQRSPPITSPKSTLNMVSTEPGDLPNLTRHNSSVRRKVSRLASVSCHEPNNHNSVQHQSFYQQRSEPSNSVLSSEITDPSKSDISTDISRQFSKRDAMKQFNVRHFSKIVDFVTKFRAHLPIPSQCLVEMSPRGQRKPQLVLCFVCARNSVNCLYGASKDNAFRIKTKYSRLWLQMMSLSYQVDAGTPLGQSSPRLSELRSVWERLMAPTGSLQSGTLRHFATVVSHSFPTARDEDHLMSELHKSRFFDIFEFNAVLNQWACFLCNHPEKSGEWLNGVFPTLAGTLKEKRGRLRFLKPWKTRHYTLSGAQFTYEKRPRSTISSKHSTSGCASIKDSSDSASEYGSLSVSSIHSVRAIRRGNRDLPRALEICTQDRQYWLLKATDDCDVASWVKCLQVAVARNQANGGSPSSHHRGVLEEPPALNLDWTDETEHTTSSKTRRPRSRSRDGSSAGRKQKSKRSTSCI